MTKKFHFLVLGAQRKGIVNPLAEAAGVSHKCLMPMAGKPLIEHTVSAIAASPEAGAITISIEDEEALTAVPYVRDLIAEGRVRVSASGDNLFESVAAALKQNEDFPAIVTTADNVLITPEMIRHFSTAIGDHDGAVATIRKELLIAKYPKGQRRFHAFNDGEFSNCNLYALATPQSLSAARAFAGGGQFLKSLKRVYNAFGLVNMLGYRFRWFSHETAVARAGKRFGVDIIAIDMPFPEAPIDVDNERTARIAEQILLERQGAAAAQ